MIHKTFLLNEGSIEEQEKILKFFFLIDPDQIIMELNAIPIPQNVTDICAIDNLFHTVFEKIYTSSALYNPVQLPHSFFFGEPGCLGKTNDEKDFKSKHLDTLKNFCVFLKLSFRNYCITQGFFYNLTKKNSNSYIPLSAPYEQFLNSGYFANPEYTKDVRGTLGHEDNRYQFYNSRYWSLKTLGNDSFLWKMLIDCSLGLNSSIPLKGERFNFKVPLIYKYWIYFIFIENKIRSLSRNITKNSSRISNTYKGIFEIFQSEEEKLDLYVDKFIFRTLGEYYFGFSSIAYINWLLNKIHRLSENKDTADKDSYLIGYRGQILESILSQLSLCPLPYSRHFFLKYALEALRNNKVVECGYLSHSSNIVMSRLPSEKTIITKEELSARGLELTMKFFHTLNNITLPVLSCLWRIILEKFIDNNDQLLDFYRIYINAHYNILTFDFTSLSLDDIEACCCNLSPIVPKNDLHYSFSFESLDSLIKNTDFYYFKSEKEFLKNISSGKLLSNILHDFLEFSCNKQQAISNLKYLWGNGPDQDITEYNTFRFNRAKNIFTLLS